jgi:hypothetical protein
VISTVKLYLTADEVSEMLGISKGHACAMIRDCNAKLQQDGYLTVAGKVPKKFFGKKYFGFDEMIKEEDDAGI